MKKLLLASTALVFSAAVANAQAVSIGGEGRMGIMGADTGAGWTWMQENRLQFNFSVSVEADHGLTFGAFSRARINNGGGAGGNGGVISWNDVNDDGLITANEADRGGGFFSGSSVWVESNGLRLTFGNTDGAVRGAGAAFGYLGGCGVGYEGGQQCGDSLGLLGNTHGFASTGGGAASRVRVDYSMGSTRVAVSHDRGGNTEIGVRTSFDAWTVAIGYTTFGVNVTTASVAYNGGSWSAGVGLATGGGTTNYVLQGSANVGGGSLYGYVGRVFGANSYGLNYGYGLGGGATLSVGAERVGTTTTASVGVAFGF